MKQHCFIDDAERASMAALVREGVDRVVRNRMDNPQTDRDALRADLDAFLQEYAGRSKHRTDDDIDDLVTQARERASKQ